MKRRLTIFTLAAILVFAGASGKEASAQVGVGVNITYQDFYDDLSPYGQWVDYPDQGYVWIPEAGPDFRPYNTNGHWVWSDEYEWMWVSDYSWGWAPFHYGRWLQDPYYGWMWVPGYEWAPAWVAWRDGGDYYGWAPLRPGINIGIGFSFGNYNPPINDWCFAPRRYITSPRIYNYCLPQRQNITIINNTTIINNYSRRSNNVFVTGPRRGDAERYAGRIRPVRFRESNAPGRSRMRNNEVSFYRPNIRRDNDRSFAPHKFEPYNRDAMRRSGNEGRNDRNVLSRRNGDSRQPATNNNRAADRRRNIIGRNNNQPDNNDGRITARTPNDNRNNERRNILDRNNNNNQPARPNTDNRNNERRDIFDKARGAQPADNKGPERREVNRPVNTDRQAARRNVLDRGNRPADKAPRQTRPVERRMEARPQNNQQRQNVQRRTPRPQIQQPNRQPRQFSSPGAGNRGSQPRGGNDHRSGRRN